VQDLELAVAVVAFVEHVALGLAARGAGHAAAEIDGAQVAGVDEQASSMMTPRSA